MGVGSPSLAAAGEGWGGGRWQVSGGNEGAHEIAVKQIPRTPIRPCPSVFVRVSLTESLNPES